MNAASGVGVAVREKRVGHVRAIEASAIEAGERRRVRARAADVVVVGIDR